MKMGCLISLIHNRLQVLIKCLDAVISAQRIDETLYFDQTDRPPINFDPSICILSRFVKLDEISSPL